MYKAKHSIWQKAGVMILCIAVLLGMLMPQTMTANAEDSRSTPTYYDGTYEGSGKGYSSVPIKVKVVISREKISEISVISHEETQSYWKKIDLDQFFAGMIEKQSSDVDAVSGATESSNGLKRAVNDALEKAETDPDGFYSSGKGTKARPYIINTADQLKKFAEAVDSGEGVAADGFKDKYIALGSDIELSDTENWNPIGTEGAAASAKKFAGTFDGKGHTIDKLTYRAEGLSSETNVGLFASLSQTAVIKNVNLRNVDIEIKGSGVLRAGGIAGDTVNAASGTTVGTLIESCSAAGSVSADSSGQSLVFAAGIVARAMTWVKAVNCWTDVEASAVSGGGNNSGYAGGIMGMSGNNTLIANCAVFGDSYGCSPKSTNFGGMAGGLGGMLTAKAYNNYATGNVTIGNGGTSHEWIGALAGEFPSGGMTNSGGTYVYPDKGAFREYGYYADDIVLTVEKWAGDSKTETTPEVRAVGTTSGTMNSRDTIFEGKAVKMSRSDMESQNFADTLNGNLKEVSKLMDAYGYDVRIRNWKLQGSKVLPTGDVWYNSEPDASIFESGTGTKDDPFRIKTKEQLRAFAGSLTEGIDYDGYFVNLTDDIDISDEQWQPIGGQDFAFNGTFDGDGHAVTGMKAGSKDTPYKMTGDNPYMGFFGVLGKDAVIKNLELKDVAIYADMAPGRYAGGIAAINDAYSNKKSGMLIDSCCVTGKIEVTSSEGNTFAGGLIAYQNRGAMINSWTDVDMACTVKKGDAIAEVGGLVALNNRGLVANCYTLGDVYASASRNNGDEGMAATGNLVGVNAGDLVGCYSKGGNETGEHSVYAGELAGWITGIGKVYSCHYNKEARMVIDGRTVAPPADFGTKVAPGVNEEGDAYVGGIADDLKGYTADGYKDIASSLNCKFAEYPIDISIYGVESSALKKWKFDEGNTLVTFDPENSSVTYKQPEAEIIPPVSEDLRDGIWFGRSKDESAIARITVKGGTITKVEAVKGVDSSDAFREALDKAQKKSVYGDATGYGRAEASLFGGGSGTKEDPYRISNEKQLRALAKAICEDESFKDVYFRQTADISLGDEEWLPIGHVIYARINQSWKQYAAYPFQGHYDGHGHSITGLSIGSKDDPSRTPAACTTAGLFGFVSGAHNDNGPVKEGELIAEIKNIELKDAQIHIKSAHANYAGAVAGNAQNGFIIDNCYVSGNVSSISTDAIARAGGLAGNILRGTVMNCSVDADVFGDTDAGNAYVGGMYAMDNRAGTINCCVTGNVSANAGANNKVHIGGMTGQFGGHHYNCYTSGNVTSLKTTSDAGLVNGRHAGIAGSAKVYFDNEAELEVAGSKLEALANGVVVSSVSKDSVGVCGKTRSQLGEKDLAEELNKNKADVKEALQRLGESISAQTDLTHTILFTGSSEDLLKWESKDGLAKLVKKEFEKDGPGTYASDDKQSEGKEVKKQNEKKAVTKAAAVLKGKTYKKEGSTYKVDKVAAGKEQGSVTFTRAKNVRSVSVPKTVKLADGKNYKVTAIGAKAVTGKKIKKVTVGTNVESIKKSAFANSKVKTMILKTKKLTGGSVKGSLKKSEVKTIKVKVGSKKINNKYVKKYKKIFTKKNTGKKVKVK